MNEEKLKLALAILSDKKDLDRLDRDNFGILGFVTYKFTDYYRPSDDVILEKAREIAIDSFYQNPNRFFELVRKEK